MKLRLLLPFLVLAACGGSSTGPVSQATAQDYCQQGCDHEHTCDPTTVVADCVSSCVGDVVGIVREDVFVDVTDCQTALACGVSNDACFEQNCAPTSTHQAYEDKCRTALLACDVSQSDIDATCEVDPTAATGDSGFFCAFTPEIMADLTACFDEACADINACFQTVATQHGIDL